ncbi:probable 3-dehydroquinate dehydratase [Melanopsichium pennsylvanicum]|uniref:Catabolic 3-dehydroquinase n=2 Tax=Melanopsichium pennsylvanicum TaxID=63383 RepID=A0AAJ4XF72_9BASI|nr:probable 3-dehydroquinate dehydratase [Melanopsichium pennsylvanicum 4]SNX81354.1 probable 3-dehydroquinate dehydratase [Melanopsichium pennsylvanicum]
MAAASSSTSKPKILLINGPNLNLLGTREPQKYGKETLSEVENKALARCNELNFSFEAFQSNHEGAIVDRIHTAGTDGTTAIIINAGAYTHTSIALRDALSGVCVPFIEVHITNIHARESFRHRSYLSDIANGVIVGLGSFGYIAAIWSIAEKLKHGGFK